MKGCQLGVFALVLGVLASGCGGGGGGSASGAGSLQLPDIDPRAARCNLSPEVCDILPVYDNGEADRLILSHNGLDAAFFAGPNIAARAQGEGGIQDSDTFFDAPGNRLVIAGRDFPLDEASVFQERLAYCTVEYETRGCLNDYSDTPLGYDYYVRYPGLARHRARDIQLSKFTVLKTARSNDHIAFGVAASMKFKYYRRGPDQEVTSTVISEVYEVLGKPGEVVGGYTLTAAAYRMPGEVVDAVTLTMARRPGYVVGGYTLTAARNIGDVVGGFTLAATGKPGDVFNGYTLTAAGNTGDVVGAVTLAADGDVGDVVGGFTLTAAGSIGDVVNGYTLTTNRANGYVLGGYTLTAAGNDGDVFSGYTLTAAGAVGDVVGGVTLTASVRVIGGTTLTAARAIDDIVNGYTLTAAGNPGDVIGGYTLTAFRNPGEVVGGETLTMTLFGDVIGISERITTHLVLSSINVYQIEQLGAFVSGPRFDSRLPLGGRAAYLGFANAYAHSSNKNFQPFRAPNGLEGDFTTPTRTVERGGSNFGSGHAAMIFKFDSDGASFESGYLDLAGPSSVDQGAEVRRGGPVPGGLIPDEPVVNTFLVDPAGQFANPDFSFVSTGSTGTHPFRERYQVLNSDSSKTPYDIERTIRNRVSDGPFAYEPNPGDEFEIRDQAGSGPGQSSGLSFSLFPNELTEDRMDFTMQMVVNFFLPGNNTSSCYTTISDGMACQPRKRFDPDDPAPLGAGVVRFYGGPATLENKGDLGDRAPTFAAGVWQFNDIVYIDLNEDGYGHDDELIAIVDLVGTIGGLIYDADPGPLPTP